MLAVTLTMLAMLAGLTVAAASLARIQTETEELLDGYATILAEARERYRLELNARRKAMPAAGPESDSSNPYPSD